MRRILLLNTDLEIGGTPTVVRELALRLRDASMTVDVASLKSIGPVGEQLKKLGVDVTAFDARSTLDLLRVRRALTDHIQSHGYDTVFSFLVHGNTLAALVRQKCPGVSRWIQSIQTTQARPKWHWHMQRFASRAADVIIVPSESVAQIAHDRSGIARERIVVIPNAIDVERFVSAQHSVFMNPVGRITFVGRLDPVKRVDDLINAHHHLPDSFVLDVWGEGSERAHLEALIVARKLSERVKLRGATADLISIYQQADVLVLPSDSEGFGLVLIEAMAASVPVIGTNVPGIRDVIRHQENGLLVPARDPHAIAQAIMKLAADRSLQLRLIENGLKDVRAKYSWASVIQSYRQLLS